MRKEILKRGYVTHALTDSNGTIYGITNDQITWELYIKEFNYSYYWSEVYCEAGCLYTIIRKGTLLVNVTADELKKYHEQSKINLN